MIMYILETLFTINFFSSFFLDLLERVSAARMAVSACIADVAEASVAFVHKSPFAEYVDLVCAVLRMLQLLKWQFYNFVTEVLVETVLCLNLRVKKCKASLLFLQCVHDAASVVVYRRFDHHYVELPLCVTPDIGH